MNIINKEPGTIKFGDVSLGECFEAEESYQKDVKMLEEMQEMLDKLHEIHDAIGVDDTKKRTFRMNFTSGYIARKVRRNNADL